MAWLIKKPLKDGRFSYYIAYREKRGNRSVIKTQTTKTDKKYIAKKLLQRFEDDHDRNVGVSKILMSDFYPAYLRWSEKQKAPKTTRLEKACIENTMDCFGDFYLDAFTQGMVEEYKMARLDKISPVSVNIELRMLHSIFNYGLKQSHLDKNPFSGFTKCKERQASSLPIFMKIDEVARLLDVIYDNKDHKYWQYVNFLFRTGARREEILHVNKEDIDLENRVILLTKTKTGKPRYVPIDDKLYEIIEQMEVESGKLFDYHPHTVTHKFAGYLKKAGINGDYSLKTTRKTFASHLVLRGVDLSTVQDLLGHQDPKVTRDHYAKLAPDHLQSSVKKLPY